MGEERVQNLLEQTQQIEAEGNGMLTEDGSRQRTKGGIFFKLVKNQTKPKERWLSLA
ncbi:MAG: hypothetical protein KJ077_28025 [Anaerolineae bacterium]|nr:hypothetical protein [Anaerolineae bacterium]